jgi:hypothetical protein
VLDLNFYIGIDSIGESGVNIEDKKKRLAELQNQLKS